MDFFKYMFAVLMIFTASVVYSQEDSTKVKVFQKGTASYYSSKFNGRKTSSGELVSKGTEKVYVERETLIKNQPEYEVCNPANVIIDPTCDGDLSKATFVAHEYNTSLAELKKDEYVKTIEKYEEINPETGEKITVEKVTESGFYKNLDSIDIDAVEFVSDEYGSEAANTLAN